MVLVMGENLEQSKPVKCVELETSSLKTSVVSVLCAFRQLSCTICFRRCLGSVKITAGSNDSCKFYIVW